MPELTLQRVSKGQSNHSDVHGLGLSIVHAIATAHQATITTRAQADGGLHVQVSFAVPPGLADSDPRNQRADARPPSRHGRATAIAVL